MESSDVLELWGDVTPLFTRVRILWAAKASAIHRKISFWVIREICSYVEDTKELVAIYQDRVKRFDLDGNRWEELCALRKQINVDYYSSATFVSMSRVFVCGGGDEPCTCHVDNRTYLLEGDGVVQELPHMRVGRECAGLISDPGRKAIYVFGGHNGPSTCYTDLKSSERFRGNQWSPLPDMHLARSFFNPCWYGSLVYLCGGWTNSVETYNPQSNAFTLLGLTLPEAESNSAVVDCGRLTVLSFSYISKLQRGVFTSEKRPEYCPWSNCTPVINGEVVYLVILYPGESCLRGISLTHGALAKAIDLEQR